MLEIEKQFYENLYKSRRTCSQQNELSFKYEELSISTLTDEQRQSAEGVISLEECTKVLNFFPLNKVPGNDGLLLSFTKYFEIPLRKF